MKNERYGIEASVAELVRQRRAAGRASTVPAGRVRTAHWGNDPSVFHGRGMEYDESRPYQPGDDVRTIDWRVLARTGRVHTKLFCEDRERPTLLLIDARASMRFGTRDSFKSVLAARAAAALAWDAVDAGERVGGVVLRPSRLVGVPAHRGRSRLLAFLRSISEATGEETDAEPPTLARGLRFLSRSARPGARIFLFSDFADLDEEAERQMVRLGQRCDLTALLIHDPLEVEAPDGPGYRVSDGDRVVHLPTQDHAWRRQYTEVFAERRRRIEDLCSRQRAGFLALCTGEEYRARLRGLIQRRNLSARRRGGRS
jgi:uncharacterized protein (DUF58 family)